MTAIEQEVPSRELCQQLKDLGWPQEGSLFWWVKYHPAWILRWYNHVPEDKEKIAAPTVGEMGRVLKFDIGYNPNVLAEAIIERCKLGLLKLEGVGRWDTPIKPTFEDKP